MALPVLREVTVALVEVELGDHDVRVDARAAVEVEDQRRLDRRHVVHGLAEEQRVSVAR